MVLEGIVKDGLITRGWIGVEPNELTPELAQTFGVTVQRGVIITGVLQNGPAALAGIRPGDVMTSVAGQPVGSVTEMLSRVASLKPGHAAIFEVHRAQETVQLPVMVGKRPRPQRRLQE
jgi:S1-C subfamily serine protease